VLSLDYFAGKIFVCEAAAAIVTAYSAEGFCGSQSKNEGIYIEYLQLSFIPCSDYFPYRAVTAEVMKAAQGGVSGSLKYSTVSPLPLPQGFKSSRE